MSALRVLDVDGVARQQRNAQLIRLLWIAGACILMLALAIQPFRDTDVWWHLALGRYITAHGIPSREPFSFLTAAHPWVGQQWLYEVVLAGLVGAGGPALASVVMGLAAAAALAVAALAVPRSARVGGAWTAVAVVLSGLVMAQVIGVRAQVLTLLGTAVVLLVVTRWREGRTGAVWALPPLFLLWANLHAGFVSGLALALVALAVAGPLRPAERVSRRHLAAAIAVSLLATLLNPAGPGLYGYVAETFGNPTLTSLVTEWASPDFHNVWLRIFELEAGLLVVLWMLGGGPDRLDLVLAVGLLVATLQAQRNVSLFAIVALPQVAVYGERACRLRVTPRLRGRRLRQLRPGAAFLLVGVLAAATAATVAPGLAPAATASFEASRYPRAAADYVAAHLSGQRLYSPDTWGGYLAYRFPQGRVVFLYDETAIFGSAALQRYLDIHLLRSDWVSVLEAEDIHHAIVPSSSQEASALHEVGWTIACYDAASASLVMSAPPGGSGSAAAPLQLPPRNAPRC